MLKEINGDEFDKILIENLDAVITFYADYAPPSICLLEELEEFDFYKCNVDEQSHIAHMLDVKAVPTVIYMKKGLPTTFKVGDTSKDTIVDWLRSYGYLI